MTGPEEKKANDEPEDFPILERTPHRTPAPDQQHIILSGLVEHGRTPRKSIKITDVHNETRRQALETFHQSLEVCDAIEADIPAIIEIYSKLYYDRTAFQLLADKELCRALDKSRDRSQRNRVSTALKEVSTGGEFAQLTRKEIKKRMNKPGERMLVIKEGSRVIGVNSYCIGPSAQRTIAPRFDAIELNNSGKEWKRKLRSDQHEVLPVSYPHLLQIHDTFFAEGYRGKGLFQRFYERTIDYELSHPDKYITEENINDWAIYYFVNRFESIFAANSDSTSTLDIADAIQINNDTISAGLKFGAQQIGITHAKDLYPEEGLDVPSLEGPEDILKTLDGKSTVKVHRGYLDMLAAVKTLRRQRDLREGSTTH